MISARPETFRRPENPASNQLTSNAERIAWQAHQLAVEIADNEPSAVSHTLRRAATAGWRRTFLDLPE